MMMMMSMLHMKFNFNWSSDVCNVVRATLVERLNIYHLWWLPIVQHVLPYTGMVAFSSFDLDHIVGIHYPI